MARDAEPGDPRIQQQLSYLQGLAVRAVAERYETGGLAIDLRANVNPFQLWYWLGGILALAGAGLALWPAPTARRRPVSDIHAARLARELSRV